MKQVLISEMLGQSESMNKVRKLIQKVAPTDASVLIMGESGTGKELVARAIHQCSRRNEQRFIVVDCASLPEHLLESELFGHEKGAFTSADQQHIGLIEEADGGTLFLDEIGEMASQMQSKLLRFLQEHEFRRVGGNGLCHANVRVLAATHQNLAQGVLEETFRKDLYYRLNVINIQLPPLRRRVEDIPVLAEAALARECSEGAPAKSFTPEALATLVGYSWPGNVRELENFVQRVSILTEDTAIGADEVSEYLRGDELMQQQDTEEFPSLAKLECDHIQKTLVATAGNKPKAAELLGISLRTLYNRIHEYGLAP